MQAPLHSPLSIRTAAGPDTAVLAEFAARTFADTYRDLDDPADIAAYVAEHFSVPAVDATLRDPRCVTLLACADDTLAGYAVLKATPPPECVPDRHALELARFYLGADFTGRRLGEAFMHAVNIEARRRGARTLCLSVYERNVRAVRFYERMGFRRVGDREFLFGGRVHLDPVYASPVWAEA